MGDFVPKRLGAVSTERLPPTLLPKEVRPVLTEPSFYPVSTQRYRSRDNNGILHFY
jgi:hypothetical protein